MAENQKINSRVWGLLICAWVAIAASQVITFSYGMMLPDIRNEFGLDVPTAAKIAGIGSWCAVFSLIPFTLLFTKRSPKFSIPLLLLVIGVAHFIFARATGLPMLYVGRIGFAMFSQVVAPMLAAVKVRGVPPDHITQINGIEYFTGPIGQVIATLTMAQILLLAGGWRGVYTIISLILFLSLILFFIIYGKGDGVTYGQQEAPASAAPQVSVFSALKEAWTRKVVWLTAIAWPGTTIVWMAMFYYFPTYAMEAHGITRPQAGVVLSMIPIFSALASLTSPKIAKKVGVDKPLIVSWALILPVAYFLMTRVSSVPLMCLFSAIAGYGAYCFVPLAFSNLYKIGLSRAAVTIATGTVLSFVAVGSATAGTVVGELTRLLGLKTGITVSCLSPLWFGIFTIFLPELGAKKMAELKRLAEEKAAGKK